MSESTGISRSAAVSIARQAAEEAAQKAAQKALREAQRYTDQQVNEIMKDIDQMSRELQRSIETQTAAIIAGVAATTAAVTGTTEAVTAAQSEVSETRIQLSKNISLQLQSDLQLELSRKLNDARASSTKFKQFFDDIKSRFDRSVQGVFLNRTEYEARFQMIFDEYENKIRSIGEHIFQIRDEIRLVESSASESMELIHGLPMEVDLYRLELRSEELDQTVQLLEASRLEEIRTALGDLQTAAQQLSYANSPDLAQPLGIEALVVSSDVAQDLLVGSEASRAPGDSVHLDTQLTDPGTSCLNLNLLSILNQELGRKTSRELSESELAELGAAVESLLEDGLISPDDAVLADAVVKSKKIQTFS